MAKRKKKMMQHSVLVGLDEKLCAALRSVIRDWQMLRAPLLVDEIKNPLPTSGAQRFRVRGAESYEELQEGVIQFAGRVWQLKDGLIKWLQTRPSLRLVFSDTASGATVVGAGGDDAARTIEEAAKLCMPLLLCADLYNSHKHYDDCNRSGYQPFLNGVQLDGSKAGTLGIRYDGTRKIDEITVSNPTPVPFRIEVQSRNQPVDFGDAVVMIGRALNYWIPLVRQMELLSPSNAVDKAILDDLAVVEAAVKNANAFIQNENR
jgi:hypothetical protein